MVETIMGEFGVRGSGFGVGVAGTAGLDFLRRLREEAGEFRGGCRARAKVLAGSVDAADPWMDQHLREGGAPHPGANVEVSWTDKLR